MVNWKIVWDRAREGIVTLALFVGAFATALHLSAIVHLPFRNPYGIVSIYNPANLNPGNSFARYLASVIFSLMLFWLFKRWRREKKWLLLKLSFICLIMLNLWLVGGVGLLNHYQGNADLFDIGEMVGPAAGLIQGTPLYSGMLFLHGAGRDALTGALAFKLLGHSLGAFFLTKFILDAIAGLEFFLLLASLLPAAAFMVPAALWLYLSPYNGVFSMGDLLLWPAIAILALLVLGKIRGRLRVLGFIALGLLSSLCMVISIDRGTYMAFLLALVSGLWLFFREDTDGYVFAPKEFISRIGPVLLMVSGYLLGLAAWLAAIGWVPFKAFLRLTYWDWPRYDMQMFSLPMPSFSENPLYWGPVAALIATLLLLVALMKPNWRKPSRGVFLATALTLFAAAYFQSGVSRADIGHAAYGSTPIWLALFYTLWLVWKDRKRMLRVEWGTLSVVLALLATVFLGTLPSTLEAAKVPTGDYFMIHYFDHLQNVPDSFWVPKEAADVTTYVKDHSGPKDGLFVFTNAPLYYYLTDRPNPTRFYITWFADPDRYEAQLLQELKAKPPKLIIWQNSTWDDQSDGVSNQQRIPQVSQWIQDNYHPQTTVGKTVILARN